VRSYNFTIRRLLLASLVICVLVAFLVVPRLRSHRWANHVLARIPLDRGYSVSIHLAPDQLTPVIAEQEENSDRRSNGIRVSRMAFVEWHSGQTWFSVF